MMPVCRRDGNGEYACRCTFATRSVAGAMATTVAPGRARNPEAVTIRSEHTTNDDDVDRRMAQEKPISR